MVLLIKWDLEILEVFADQLKKIVFHAAQQYFITAHPFPQNVLRNVKQVTE